MVTHHVENARNVGLSTTELNATAQSTSSVTHWSPARNQSKNATESASATNQATAPKNVPPTTSVLAEKAVSNAHVAISATKTRLAPRVNFATEEFVLLAVGQTTIVRTPNHASVESVRIPASKTFVERTPFAKFQITEQFACVQMGSVANRNRAALLTNVPSMKTVNRASFATPMEHAETHV